MDTYWLLKAGRKMAGKIRDAEAEESITLREMHIAARNPLSPEQTTYVLGVLKNAPHHPNERVGKAMRRYKRLVTKSAGTGNGAV